MEGRRRNKDKMKNLKVSLTPWNSLLEEYLMLTKEEDI